MKTEDDLRMEIAMKKSYLTTRFGMKHFPVQNDIDPELENAFLDSIIYAEHQFNDPLDSGPKIFIHQINR